MKIRIKGNSIRYRLTKTDIANFGKNGYLEERTEFPGGSVLLYCLQRNNSIENLSASFAENKITVFVPQKTADEWVTTDVVGFNYKMDTGNGKELFLLVEKDFVCLDHTLEDQGDNYPNPNKTCLPSGRPAE